MRLGVISDTHGRMHPGVAEAFAGVDRILHAGDVKSLRDLADLRSIAPVTAVAGNCDRGGETGALLHRVETAIFAGVRLAIVHELADLPADAEADVIVHGHTHRCEVVERDGKLLVNPGTAAWPGDRARPTVCVLELSEGRASAVIVDL